jgi:uncharacterized protein YfeS
MTTQNFYYDDSEIGPAKKTSHPNFVKNLPDEFYYDCTEEFSPFGNDDGADLLYNLEDWYRETKGKDLITNWLFENIDEGGFKYSSKNCSELNDAKEIEKIHNEDQHFFSFMDNSIIAAAFGQYKITGSIDSELKKCALQAIERRKNFESDDQEYLDRLSKMQSDLEKIGYKSNFLF